MATFGRGELAMFTAPLDLIGLLKELEPSPADPIEQ
jgi:hypothetical protein